MNIKITSYTKKKQGLEKFSSIHKTLSTVLKSTKPKKVCKTPIKANNSKDEDKINIKFNINNEIINNNFHDKKSDHRLWMMSQPNLLADTSELAKLNQIILDQNTKIEALKHELQTTKLVLSKYQKHVEVHNDSLACSESLENDVKSEHRNKTSIFHPKKALATSVIKRRLVNKTKIGAASRGANFFGIEKQMKKLREMKNNEKHRLSVLETKSKLEELKGKIEETLKKYYFSVVNKNDA